MAKKDEKNIKDKTSFMKSFKAELKKVVWPTPKQLFNNTVAVLTIVVIVAVIVFILDTVFRTINKYGIDKIKESISNSVVENTTAGEAANEAVNEIVNGVENNTEAPETTDTEAAE